MKEIWKTIEEFDGLRVAARAMTGNLNASGCDIGRVANGKSKSAYGRQWFCKKVI